MRIRAVLLVVAGALAAAAPAHAGVTIGSDLARTPGVDISCGGSTCTYVQTALPGNAAPLTAPSAGVIVRWRVKTAPDPTVGTVKLMIVHTDGSGPYSALSSVQTVTPPTAGGIQAYGRSPGIPIAAGDAIGVQLTGTQTLLGVDDPGAEGQAWEPALAIGETKPSDFDDTDVEYLFNADIEPDADGDHFGDETQDACPTDPASQAKPCTADLAISMTAAPASVLAPADITYTIVARNLGPGPSGDATLTTNATVPFSTGGAVGVPVTSATAPCTFAGLTGARCALGSLAPGQTVTLTVVARVGAITLSGHAANLALLSGGRDPNLANNTATTSTQVTRDSTAPVVRLTVPKRKLGASLTVKATASEPCATVLEAFVDKATKRKLHLSSTRVGRLKAKLPAGATTLKLKLSARLKHARRVTLTLHVTGSDDSTNQIVDKPIKVTLRA